MTPVAEPPAGATARLFLALWPDEPATLQGLRAWQAALRWPASARPTAAANLHLTLHFIGAVPRERLAEVADGLRVPAVHTDITLSEWTVWPHGVAVLAPRAVPAALLELHGRLAERLAALQLPVDTRPWRPHATLARRAAGAALAGAPPAPVTWPVRQGHVLAESASGYHLLRRYA
ncbi:RNA 2',3'-cyclic phosphodiesterase [Ideonella sp.]|uniref:RNA 2',3'-cyclic phosphodiesterase n=1 Tax=Ideonella sp. TaxID=1929293 RepID=UPI0035B04746